MKKLIYIAASTVCCIGLSSITSCNTFESEPLNWNLEENVLNPKDSLAENMKGMFNAIYNSLPNLHTRLSNSYLDAATDDAVPTKDMGGDGSLENYRNGRLSPDNIDNLDGNAWANFYKGIRRANLFLKHIEGYPHSTMLPQEEITRMKAEARFLRAYFYFELVKRWGGVPLMGDKVYNYDEDWNIPQSSLDDCIKYILDEISPEVETSCFKDMYPAMAKPDAGMENTVGRMNQGAALALISRIKLYYASPLYTKDVNETEKTKRWKAAAEAAKAVIDLGIYDLHIAEVDKDGKGNPSFLEFFGEKKAFPNKEGIMIKEAGASSSLETNNSPCGYQKNTCKGYTSPSQNLVDAFLMKDGKMKDDPTSKYKYDKQNPYVNRDPRLTYTVFYNGSRWLKREVETFNGGKDRSNVPNMFTTQTGYYLRKFLGLNEEKNDNASFTSFPHHYYIIRYAEILLNYAEALNEVNDEANKEAMEKCIIDIRKRAGIEAGDDNRYGLPVSYDQEEMRNIIRNERRIELAFEEHRFWDIRRWMIAEDVMNKPILGVEITKLSDGSYNYEYPEVRQSQFDAKKMYWYPVPRTEMQGNPNLKQTQGWDY